MPAVAVIPVRLSTSRIILADAHVRRHIHKNLVDAVYVDVFGRNVFEVSIIDLRAYLDVMRHPRRGGNIIKLPIWMLAQFVGVNGLARKWRGGNIIKLPVGMLAQFVGVNGLARKFADAGAAFAFGVDLPHPLGVDLPHPLDYFKQPCSSRDAVFLERWRHGEANRLVGA